MELPGLEKWTPAQVESAVAAGGRLIFYEYCVSLVAITLRRASRIHVVGPSDHGFVRGLPYALLSLVFGWWGLPWGLIYTPIVIFTDLTGGCEVTAEVLSRLRETDSRETPA
jgi:hypothetical protein